MATILEIVTQALLAQAAYAPLPIDSTHLDSLQKQGGMSEIQADDFIKKWRVVTQYSDSSGASATVFEERATGKRYLAIRGTESPGDFNADYILALGFPSYLNPQFIQLRSVVQTWIDDGTLGSGFTVTGHSLGGYLATALGTWFRNQVTDIYTYNGPGLGLS